MNNIDEKVKLMEKYAYKIKTSFNFHLKGGIPSKKIDNALSVFAQGMDRETIIGFYDTTIRGNGKEGYIFTEDKIYYKEMLEKPKKIWYEDIKNVEVKKKYKDKDCDRELEIVMKDKSIIKITSIFLNKTPLCDFLNEIIKIENESKLNIEHYKNENNYGAISGGIALGNYGTVNKLFDEERFNASQGHGFAAERANHLYDKITGKEATILGDSNIKHGADRLVNGIEIQSKYCKTGYRCISECFDNGKMKYTIENGTKPMQIEVPSDKYQEAIRAMEDRIKRGQVPGVKDPNEAKNIVRKGHFTYLQAKNIAKAGTIESLAYDSVNGIIISSSSFGLSSMITFANSIWNGEDFDVAIKNATYSGIKVGGTTFITSVLASQLSKAGLNSALVGGSETIVKIMGPKASAVLVNAFRGGSNIYGAAAMKSAAKLLRGNTITGGVTVIVLSSFDIVNIFRGRISGKQLFKNVANTISTVGGGTAGWMGGAAIGSAILPGIGTAIGAIIGSIGGGAISGKVSSSILNEFVEDDAEEMVKIIEQQFSDIAVNYLLTKKEAEKSADLLRDILDGNKLKDMYASSDRVKFAEEMLIPIVEKIVINREIIKEPTYLQMQQGLRIVLEEIYDTENI